MVRRAKSLLRGATHPPARLRRGPFREAAFTSRLHSERNASLLGIALGITFIVCFLTGLISHLIQQPPDWFSWPARPAGLYRITQGLHVATGVATIPLLLAKLWTVFPKLWTWPPVTGALHALERISLVPLVGGSVFLLFTGMANIFLWYPWGFFFPTGHYWAAWITIGALVVHIGTKASIARRSLGKRAALEPEPSGDGLSRRGFLGVIAAVSGLLTVTTVGQTFRPLNFVGLLAPRRPDVGPQGFPVNKSAASARVLNSATAPNYFLSVRGNVRRPLHLSLAELQAMSRDEATLPISCVEGWSTSQTWQGVKVIEVLTLAGARSDAGVMVESLQASGLYRSSLLSPEHVRDEDTLLALEVNGEELHIDHGYPVRLIGPNRPGVMQTKWVAGLVVL